MANHEPTDERQVEIRKYPNRRYYDTARSSYVTLSEIRELIRQGVDIRVVDSKSEEDITPKVLAQIILEHDTPKLQIFPVELLHQLIRANEVLVRGFVESFLGQALVVFIESQRLFDQYLRLTPGASGNAPRTQSGKVASAEEKETAEEPREELSRGDAAPTSAVTESQAPNKNKVDSDRGPETPRSAEGTSSRKKRSSNSGKQSASRRTIGSVQADA